jgi:hypothetical protein
LLQREALEAKAVGGASTVKVEAVVCTTLTAHSEPYNRKAIHASRLNQARMRNGIVITESDVAARNHGSQRRHRGRVRIATGQANVFGLCSGEHRRSCWSERLEVFGCPRGCESEAFVSTIKRPRCRGPSQGLLLELAFATSGENRPECPLFFAHQWRVSQSLQ